MKNEKDVNYTIHGFSIVMQIWAYEAMPEVGERFGAEDVDTSASDSHHTLEGNGEDGAEPDDSGESGGDHSSETSGSDSENEVDASGQ
ncbi:Hypothetical predicted protein [Olea europaea subsp. europaea]|uniref:Uncharacterized protein n=1 Tax=Olea europaea subsp. europaea TaxID=158383 RepID=A0A8S0UMD7_OLEEU|nr:Hypothetical predicted protein [Olea europaea subsp. europaea]